MTDWTNQDGTARVLLGNVLSRLPDVPDGSVQCCVTSPPYWGLRDYGTAQWEGGDETCDHRQIEIRQRRGLAEAANACDGGNRTREGRIDNDALWIPYRDLCGKCGARRIDQQIGLEKTPEEFVAKMVAVFREVRRVLRDDGTLWLNLGDSYATGGGAVGCCPGGGDQGERFLRQGMINTQPNRMKLPGFKPKDLCGIPWMTAFALRADGWYLRADIIWSKANPMPESVTDRPTKSHEHIFLFSKSPRYYYDHETIKEAANPNDHNGQSVKKGGFDSKYAGDVARIGDESFRAVRATRNRRDVWTVDDPAIAQWFAWYAEQPECQELYERYAAQMENKPDVWRIPTKPFKGAHFAVFPPELIEPCVLAGCPEGGTVLDPFSGSGTTGEVAIQHGRRYLGIELNPEYLQMSARRIGRATRRHATPLLPSPTRPRQLDLLQEAP